MNPEKVSQTMLALVTGAIFLFFLLKFKWLLIVGFLFGIVGLFMPGLSRTISIYWFKLAEIIGSIVSKIFLSLIYIIFLLPIALLSRLFRPDLLQLNPKKDGSYYISRNFHFTSESLKKPW